MAEFPYTNKPDDIAKLFQKLTTVEVPSGILTAVYFKSLGFSTTSRSYLFNILKLLGFIDEIDEPTVVWSNYVVSEKRGLILAAAIQTAYAPLFEESFCPYLENDETIFDFFKRYGKSTDKELILKLETFHSLNELADFQDLLSPAEIKARTVASKENHEMNIKVNPNLQLNIQIHIDPNTPDEKIEAIFKNMRKYLLEKEDKE